MSEPIVHERPLLSLAALWAKLGNDTWPEVYYPVIFHLIDVGQVAREMWNLVIRQRTRSWVATKLGLRDQKAAGAWLTFWAAAHDIGKVSPCFQSQGKTERLTSQLTAAGFDLSVGKRLHGGISTKVLAEELTSPDRAWPAVSTKVVHDVAVAVGGHHGVFPTNWDEICSPLGNGRWATIRLDMLGELARLFGLIELPPPCRPDDQSV